MKQAEQWRGYLSRIAPVIGIAWIAATASGCALTNMILDRPAHAKVSTSMKIGQGREILLIHPFVNRRSSDRCGMKKNGYNMDTASILCITPPEHWLVALLADELRVAGFQVIDNPTQVSPHTLRLDASLSQFFIEQKIGFFTVTPEADIELNVVASTLTGFQARRNFYLKGEEIAVFGTEENFRLAAEDATRQMLATVVRAVYELVQRYPELGRASHLGSPSSTVSVANLVPQ